MRNPIEDLGNEQLYLLATDVRVQLEKDTANRPVLYLLAQARAKARIAIVKLIEVQASETEAIRELQAEVRLYGDLVEHCQALLVRGREADSLIAESERAELAEIVAGMSPEEKRLIGIQQQGDD